MRYFWGARGAELSAELEDVGVAPSTADVVSGLGHGERAERARVLGRELGLLAAALDERSLGR